MEQLRFSVQHFLPEIVLTAGLLLVVLTDATRLAARHLLARVLTLTTLVAALALALRSPAFVGELWGGMVVLDPLAVFFKALLLGATLLLLLSFTFRNSRELHGLGQGELYALLLAVTLSNLLLATANDLVLLYLALEMVSIGSYVMVAYLKGDRLSNEASLKYVLFGAAATGAMLYGLTLVYGLTGTTRLAEIQQILASGISDSSRFAAYVAVLLVTAGLGFKIAAVPFHFWCPDVYEGAPTPVTAFLSVAPKAAGFAVIVRFFYGSLSTSGSSPWDLAGTIDWPQLLLLLSVLTMTLGNVAALTQTNMKRLLAYSSISHAGYILMGVVALSQNGLRGILIYLLAYLFMNLGAFLVVTLVHLHDGTFDLRDYPGLSRRSPLLTFAMAIFLFSLMGIPPLIGFFGKLFVFAAVIEKGPHLYWFAVVGAINAAVAAFYYARVLKTMIIDAGNEEKAPLKLAVADQGWLMLLVAANLVPMLFWSGVDRWVRSGLMFYSGR